MAGLLDFFQNFGSSLMGQANAAVHPYLQAFHDPQGYMQGLLPGGQAQPTTSPGAGVGVHWQMPEQAQIPTLAPLPNYYQPAGLTPTQPGNGRGRGLVQSNIFGS